MTLQGFDRSKYTDEQWEWCVRYEDLTGFDPMMGDFENGVKTFVDAAQFSCEWYAEHTDDAYLKITRNIPGAFEQLCKDMDLEV